MNLEEVQQRLAKLTDLATAKQKSNKKMMQRLKKRSKQMDTLFRETHEAVFEELDCLHCANCCKTTSPIFIGKDINRLAKRFRMKPIEFIEAYLMVDEDGDYVLQSSPCVFLNEDNTCQVYEDRPRACREYPHTNRKNMHQISSLTVKNASICPAVYEILERLRLVGG